MPGVWLKVYIENALYEKANFLCKHNSSTLYMMQSKGSKKGSQTFTLWFRLTKNCKITLWCNDNCSIYIHHDYTLIYMLFFVLVQTEIMYLNTDTTYIRLPCDMYALLWLTSLHLNWIYDIQWCLLSIYTAMA